MSRIDLATVMALMVASVALALVGWPPTSNPLVSEIMWKATMKKIMDGTSSSSSSTTTLATLFIARLSCLLAREPRNPPERRPAPAAGGPRRGP